MPLSPRASPAFRRLGVACAILGLLAIAVLTLTPGGGGADLPFGCVVCGPDGGVDAVANVLLFVPLGVGLAAAGLAPWRALLLVAATTVAVEALQLRIVTGRDTSLGDLVWNTVGGALGYWAVRRARTIVVPRPAAAAALAGGWAALWLAGTIVTAWSLGPALWRGRWIAHVGATVRLPPERTPTVLAAGIGGVALRRTGWLSNGPDLRARLLAGAPIAARAVVPRGTGAPVNVLVLTEGPSRHVMASLARVGDGAQYYVRTRASALKLRSPHFVLRGAFGGDADTVALSAARRGAEMVLGARRGDRVLARTVGLGPNWGWSLLLPPRLAWVHRFGWYAALWVAALVFPVAYWAAPALAVRGRASLVAAAALATPPLAFLVIPVALATAPVPAGEWMAWLAATAAGLGAGRWARQRAGLP